MSKASLEAEVLKVDGEARISIEKAKIDVEKELERNGKTHFTKADLARSMYLAISFYFLI